MSDYYAFGMLMVGRNWSAGEYRYGFQGQEMDNEEKGVGNAINYTYRVHDPKLGRFLSIDPLSPKYPFYSPYAFSGNKVVDCVELEGLEVVFPDVNAQQNIARLRNESPEFDDLFTNVNNRLDAANIELQVLASENDLHEFGYDGNRLFVRVPITNESNPSKGTCNDHYVLEEFKHSLTFIENGFYFYRTANGWAATITMSQEVSDQQWAIRNLKSYKKDKEGNFKLKKGERVFDRMRYSAIKQNEDGTYERSLADIIFKETVATISQYYRLGYSVDKKRNIKVGNENAVETLPPTIYFSNPDYRDLPDQAPNINPDTSTFKFPQPANPNQNNNN